MASTSPGSFSEWCATLSAAGLKSTGSGIRASQSNLDSMFRALDADSNGTLDTEEFVDFGLWAWYVLESLHILGVMMSQWDNRFDQSLLGKMG